MKKIDSITIQPSDSKSNPMFYADEKSEDYIHLIQKADFIDDGSESGVEIAAENKAIKISELSKDEKFIFDSFIKMIKSKYING